MISLFFEVQIKAGRTDQYLELAASLKPALGENGGCLFIDRFRSLTLDNLLLSYQIWRDEEALTAWRVHAHHHHVQTLGREKVFSDYRIRVARVIHDARPDQPIWQPARGALHHAPDGHPPRYVLVAEARSVQLPATAEWPSHTFASIYRDNHFAHLIDLPDAQSGLDFGPPLFTDPTTENFRIVEVMRDYGMHHRAEAPQHFPPVRGEAT